MTCNGLSVNAETSGDYNMGAVEITGLEPGRAYAFTVLFPDLEQWSGNLQTHPPAGRRFKIAWLSCARHVVAPQILYKIAADPLVTDVFLLGDTPYADAESGTMWGVTFAPTVGGTETEANWEAQYQAWHRCPPMKAMGMAKGILRTWNDHEAVDDFGNVGKTRAEAWWPTARSVFEMYCMGNPVNADDGIDNDALYFRHQIGPVEAFILDLLSYRTTPYTTTDSGTPESYTKTMLGEAQRDWLKNAIASSEAPFKAVMSSWATGAELTDHTDGWKNYQNEEDHLISALASTATTFWCSGDFHANRVRRETSPWHLDIQPCPAGHTNQHALGSGYGSTENYLVKDTGYAGAAPSGIWAYSYGEIDVLDGWEKIAVSVVRQNGRRSTFWLDAGTNALADPPGDLQTRYG